jgi:hypothetical protein
MLHAVVSPAAHRHTHALAPATRGIAELHADMDSMTVSLPLAHTVTTQATTYRRTLCPSSSLLQLVHGQLYPAISELQPAKGA